MGRLFRLFQRRQDNSQALTGWNRDRVANFMGLAAIICLGAVLYFSDDTKLLMPGPMASGHSAIKECSACHTESGVSKTSWIHGLTAGNPLADSNACLSCHRMPDTAFNAHSATNEVLERSTRRLTKVAAQSTAPPSAVAQNIAFPMKGVVGEKLVCATCHQEHKGRNFDLARISNEQCRSCHVVQFDSFDGHHPQFQNYPFSRRTRIIYDHAAHFGKHYPEVAKKDSGKRIPENCSTCHNSNADRRVMDVAPFDRTCASCHLDQIAGKERVSGPKGVAFLALPGLDLDTLRQKNAPIGEWPEDSEAALTPFMKLMVGRSEEGRALLETVNKLNLQDLASASDSEIQAVTKLAWEIKGLYFALVKNKASDVLADLNIGGKSKQNATLVADLTASIPRDVIASAQQEWLPRLAAETALGPGASADKLSSVSASEAAAAAPESETPEEGAAPEAEVAAADTAGAGEAAADGNKEVCKDEEPAAAEAEEKEEPEEVASDEETLSLYDDVVASADGRIALESGTPRLIKKKSKKADKKAAPEEESESEASAGSGKKPCVEDAPGAQQVASAEPAQDAGAANTEPAADSTGTSAETPEAGAETQQAAAPETPAAAAEPAAAPSGQKDDLLFPTEDELRANNLDGDAFKKAGEASDDAAQAKAPAAPSVEPAPADAAASEKQDAPNAEADANAATSEPPAAESAQSETPVAEPAPAASQSAAAPASGIESDVDPETWAEYGGWYRQDFAIYYRPAGHKDKFIYSWLVLTGRLAPEGSNDPAAEVFDSLTNKEAQGSCTKCHSVDDNRARGKSVNFTPVSLTSKRGRFTNFVHEPHLGAMDDRGCLTCHALGKNRPYIKSYEQSNPRKFAQEFSNVKKELCQTCHTQGAARQDCLMCHKYHVNGSTMPILKTKLTVQ
jgi:hypothetical protein